MQNRVDTKAAEKICETLHDFKALSESDGVGEGSTALANRTAKTSGSMCLVPQIWGVNGHCTIGLRHINPNPVKVSPPSEQLTLLQGR
jgi:hypothetical protein